MTKVIEINPKLALAYANRGRIYGMNLGNYKKAIADFTKAIEIDPNNASVYGLRGVSYDRLRDYKKASKDARKACDLGDCRLLNVMKEDNLLRN
jgi:Flp pilus assembly protein TadD